MDYPSGLKTVDPAETAGLAGEKVANVDVMPGKISDRPEKCGQRPWRGNQNACKCLKDLVSAVGIEPTTY